MCGIAGILTKEPGLDTQTPLRRMQRALRHRGPDDEGVWIARAGEAHFAHTRLSVLDLSAAGHQPMSTADGRFTIIYNGEIYNFADLRAELEKEGAPFRTRSDTEVILRLYERDGDACADSLRGMFAFAIWDEQEHRCVLMRDAFGIKPLYYAHVGAGLVFASELRAILASGLTKHRTDGAALARYLETGSVPEPITMVEGVSMLEAGSVMNWDGDRCRSRRWWSVSFPAAEAYPMPDEAVGRTRAALLDSVDRHFVSDVPVGIFLSGGVDSTALLALAHHSGRREIRTFSIGVDDASRDESEIAKRTAAHFGTQHTELRLTAANARELFPRFLESVDQPTIDGFNTYSVAGIAREHGMKVVLNGLGGDELFAGYPSFEMLPRLLALSRFAGPARGLIGATLECAGARGRPGRLGSALRAGGSLAQLYSAFRGVFSRKDAAVLAQHFTGETGTAPEPAEAESPPNMRDAVSALEIQRYMRNQLLRDSDVMSMAHGLELRVPLVDRELFEVIVRIPAAIRLRPGKQLLLDAVPEIPAWVRGRAKRGFLFPYESWLGTDEWRALMAESSQDLPVRPSTWYQKWAVFVFRHWERTALKSI